MMDKLSRMRSIEGEATDPPWLMRLEEINQKIEEMEKEL